MARRSGSLLWFLALLAACLAACAGTINQSITFLADEAWESEATLSYPAEVVTLVGDQVESELNTLRQQIAAQGGVMHWERRDENGASTYAISASGRGYEILGNVAFNDMSVQVGEQDGRRQLTFVAAPATNAAGQTLTISGGEILSSNGTVNGDTVRWVNPSQAMQAVLTERGAVAPPSPVAPIAGGAALIFAGGLLAWYLLRHRGPAAPASLPAPPVRLPPPTMRTPIEPPAPDAAASRAAVIPGAPPAGRACVNCGTTLRSAARFCANCGHPQPD